MLFIEYDVDPNGEIELIALINATEEENQDPDGESWMAWRRTHDDGGLGCVAVQAEDLELMERTGEPEELRAVVERIILTDRAVKERAS